MKRWKTLPWSARFGVVLIAVYFIVALVGPWLTPYGESEVVGSELEPWGGSFLLGTDHLGRDMLTRLVYGARNTIGIALLTTCLAFLIGGGLGLLGAAVGGWVDQLLGRFVDVVMSIPSLIFALLVLTVVGTSVPALVAVIAVLNAPPVFRISRALGMNIAVTEYVEAARLRGEGLWWIVRREMLPNAAVPLVAELGMRFTFVFLFISALSFLGLGIQPPTADWGSMVRELASLIAFGDVTPLLPAGAIALLTVGVNFVVDWMLHQSSGLSDEF